MFTIISPKRSKKYRIKFKIMRLKYFVLPLLLKTPLYTKLLSGSYPLFLQNVEIQKLIFKLLKY